MIFFSSDPDFVEFLKEFEKQGIKIDLLITESPKEQGRDMRVKPNPAHAIANKLNINVKAFEKLDQKAYLEIKKSMPEDSLGFIFAYGKIIPKNIIDLFENGILNIHFSLLPEYPGASPLQQALLDNKKETGYSIFEISDKLDQGLLLTQEKIQILPDDNFDSLRSKIISRIAHDLPKLIKKYLKWEIKLTKMPKGKMSFTHRILKQDGLISDNDSAVSAYNKTRAFSRWPKTYLLIKNKRFIIHQARLDKNMLEIISIQPEGKKPMRFTEFKNGYQTLLTKMPKFVKIN